MIHTWELTGAQLNYWVALAEDIPAEQLTILDVPRTDKQVVVRTEPSGRVSVLAYCYLWEDGGPLIEKHGVGFERVDGIWAAHINYAFVYGATLLQAVCRAVVRAAFGDEVEEVGAA